MTRAIRSHARDEHGFSMVELMVVSGLLATVAGIGGDALLSTLRSSNDVQERAATIAEVRQVLDTVARDVRAANPLDASPTSSGLSLSIYCSTGSSADCTTANRRPVGYAVTASRLTRTRSGTASTVLDRDLADTSVFTYLKADGTVLAAPVVSTCVAQVRIALVVTTSSGHLVSQSTTVGLRNASPSC